MSDWAATGNQYRRNHGRGDGLSRFQRRLASRPPVNVYGYTIALNSNYVVQSLTLPNNGNVEVLAITLSNYTAALPEASRHRHPTAELNGD
jgi:hypothetical protein